ncbi:class I SAM-dependent methyltransferase [Maribacter sp. PR1]|uniref:Class I SAM-dependent methyltransferase n=1 Tax=Maribacter cobaltidurans TaxID=1178778 RepID=A0ABU7IV42_9FLAO|nr:MULTISPECIES: class I SAM-dependent methyltransferase [Maribacter]MDC6389447.1 class I SAM-dependent methyltransferase [Maribacter sp. PR1]MEE1976836.1 class I SAM-dependent methyltransferase [Maribacter cobaltidurans]
MSDRKPKSPWPTKAAMEQIYDKNLWGGDKDEFYSGIGSHDPEILVPYIQTVGRFLTSFDTPLTVCDLGCGDFNVGRKLAPLAKNYIGVDIVADLIEHNQKTFANGNVSFQSLDIAKGRLPSADCAMIRQVFQHLSNDEIKQVLPKLNNYKYVILTEHLPAESFVPNADIISGQGIRLKKQSGIDLLVPPFNLKIIEENQLLRLPEKNGTGIIVSVLYTMF